MLKVIVVDEVAEMQFNVLFCMGRRLGEGIVMMMMMMSDFMYACVVNLAPT